MADIKGTCIIFLRESFKSKGEAIEVKFLDSLIPEEANVYKTALAFSWYPSRIVAQLYKKAANALFPNDNDGLRKVGRLSAYYDLKGVYKIMVRVATIPFIIGQASKLWSVYWSQGRAFVENDREKNKSHYILKEFIDLPKVFRETMCGYIQTVVEITGGKNVKVVNNQGMDEIRWTVTWV